MLVRSLVAVLLASSAIVGCSDGVSVTSDDSLSGDVASSTRLPTGETTGHDGSVTVSAEGALTRLAATQAINDPLNTIDEPFARDWTSAATQERLASCAEESQDAADAFATASFMRDSDENGEYLVATATAGSQTPEYIEFCLNVPELARYRITTRVKAPSIDADSFFVTVNEDEPGTVPEPGIYDVSRSIGFKDDQVRTRTQNPLLVTLSPGTLTLRLYAREAGTAIRSIALQVDDSDTPVLDPDDPDTTAIAQCSANTGIAEDELDSLILQYLGNVDRRFVLTPADEERGYTLRNDYQWLTANGSGNIMCLAPPPSGGTNLIDNTITAGRIVFGSVGRDEQRLNTPLRGTFIGNGGNDEIGVIDGGVFIAGAGDDRVFSIASGLFDGGAGDDVVNGMESGTFNGGAGNDSVITLSGGTFNGGAGNDSVERLSDLAIVESVEDTGVSFSTLSAPTELQFVDSTQLSTVVTWRAPADDRIDGYVVLQPGEGDDIERSLDLGVAPISVSRFQTSGTEMAIDLDSSADESIHVRAYTELPDGTFQYSAPLEAVYAAPAVPTDSVLATAVLDFGSGGTSYERVVLADNGAVVQVNSRAPSNGDVPAFISFDSAIDNAQRIFNDTLTDNSFRSFTGSTRQYVVSGRQFQNEGATVLAFSGDVTSVVWEQALSQQTQSGGTAECRTGIVTQDDWLVCLVNSGGARVFDTDGTVYSHLSASFPFSQAIVDGDQGQLVSWSTADSTDEFTLMDLISGEQLVRSTDISTYLPGAGEWSVHALAVAGDHVIVAGAQNHACTATSSYSCLLRGSSAESYFLARVELATGRVSTFVSIPIQSRPVSGSQFLQLEKVGSVVDDTVVFSHGNIVARYELASLDQIQRQVVPGRFQGANGELTLTQEPIVGESGTTTGYDWYLVGR